MADSPGARAVVRREREWSERAGRGPPVAGTSRGGGGAPLPPAYREEIRPLLLSRVRVSYHASPAFHNQRPKT